jgi:S-adenosylmethionine decarboxylase
MDSHQHSQRLAFSPKGLHALIRLELCDVSKLERVDASLGIGRDICSRCDFHVVGEESHQFAPRGATVTFLLSESHLCIHTWPEERLVLCDIFSCTANKSTADLRILFDFALQILQKEYGSSQATIEVHVR